MVYISEDGRKNVLIYKYKPCDDSLISPLLEPYWEFCVKLVPISTAANLVTLVGFIPLVYHFLQTLYFLPKLSGNAPSWLFFVNAFCIWWYQTLDAIDGKQARRTKSGNYICSLGELFDHGCDSIGATLQTVSMAAALQLGGSIWTVLLMTAVMTIFFMSIWEQYFTGVLRFSKVGGPTEALLFLIAIHLVTGFFGVEFWFKTVEDFIPILNLPYKPQINHLAVVVVFFTLFPALYNNITLVASISLSKEEARVKGSPLAAALPYMIVYFSWLTWIIFSPERLMQTNPALMTTIFGLTSGYCITRLVISRVCNETCQSYYWIIFPYPFIALNALMTHYLKQDSFVPEIYIAMAYLSFVIYSYAHMISHVIKILSETLNIWVLTLKPH